MRVFYLCYADLHKPLGGTRHIIEVVQHLARLGHRVDLFAQGPAPDGLFSDHVKVHVVHTPSIRIVGWVLFYIRSAFTMWLEGRRNRPDVIYVREMVYNLFPGLASRALHCPLFIEVNGPILDEMRMVGSGWFELWLIKTTQRISLRSADRVVAVAEGLADQLVDLYEIDRTRILVVPNGTDPDLLQPGEEAESQRSLGMEPGPVVGFLGSCYPYHDIDTLITAAPAILEGCPGTRFLIVGDGYMRSTWMERTEREGLADHFVFTGQTPYEDIARHLKAFTVGIALFAQESHQKMNRSPMKLYDYMACGIPTIATDLIGLGDVVRHYRAGLTIPPNDAPSLAKAALTLLTDRSLSAEMGHCARQAAVSYFNWGRVAEDIVRGIEERTKG